MQCLLHLDLVIFFAGHPVACMCGGQERCGQLLAQNAGQPGVEQSARGGEEGGTGGCADLAAD
eukprot:1154332-Pelagomonas_calceolata.AAC.1